MKPLILTFTGKHVNPLDLKPKDIDILDIAHALANCNRFAGHARLPINVAQHSVYVSRLCDRLDCERQALLHDASEAYLGDITKWLKGTDAFAAYREAEERIQTQIYRRFECSIFQHPAVDAADKLMLRFEGEKAFGLARWRVWCQGLPNYPLTTESERQIIGPWAPWSWKTSRISFLDRARSVGILV